MEVRNWERHLSPESPKNTLLFIVYVFLLVEVEENYVQLAEKDLPVSLALFLRCLV